MAGRHCVRLTEGFTLGDVTGDGANFTVNLSNMNEAELEPGHEAFNGEARVSHFRADVLETDNEKFNTPFEKLRSTMENVTEDGSVMKKVTRTGADIIVPPNAFITFHYNAYMEYSDEPFDSSVLQGKPQRVKLNSGGLLPGLEKGLLTMRRSEKADILVQPEMAYGPRGCPPRIPPNSEVLFDVELIDWSVTPNSEIVDAIDEIHLSDSDWEKAKSHAMRLHLEGNDWYKNKRFHKALRAYRSAEKIVGTSRLKDDKEEKEHNALLLKLHTNMAICYNELKQYNDVCIHCRKVIDLNPNHSKGHYYWGLALTALSEFSRAKTHLLKAKSINKGQDPAIDDALHKLDERVTAAKKQEKIMWSRAINATGKSDNPKPNQSGTLKSTWKSELLAFKEDPNSKRMCLPTGLESDELEAVEADLEVLNLKMNISEENICIFKEG